MASKIVAALLLGAVLALVPAAAEETRRTSPTIAREIAASNAKTPAGHRYGTALEARVDPWLRKALERYAKEVPREERRSFDAFVRISGEGDAEEVVFDPETAVARCVAPDFRAAKYPTPPQPSWWAKIGVELH